MDERSINEKFEKEFYSIYKDPFILAEGFLTSNNGVSHCWDYAIFRGVDLMLLVDVDSAYSHGDCCDYDGITSKLELDESRFKSLPERVKHTIIREQHFEEDFEWMRDILLIYYGTYINLETRYLCAMPCPYPEYTTLELASSYEELRKMDCNDPKYNSTQINTRLGDRIVHHFCYDLIWNRIPWCETVIRCSLMNRMIAYPHMCKNKILQTIPHKDFASPGKVKMIINKHGNGFKDVYDDTFNPSILLASIASNKTYCMPFEENNHIDMILDFLDTIGTQYNVYKMSSPPSNAFMLNNNNLQQYLG